ncbi:hypothetical protein, partial [Brevibacillus porteri]|uniref:hypothetical protein n=1 Tax=Brevibacillus porteri TaxID=2126350 RepID=UPI003D1E4291
MKTNEGPFGLSQHSGGEEKVLFDSDTPAWGIHCPSPLPKGDRRAKATLRAEASQGRRVRQAGPLFEVP